MIQISNLRRLIGKTVVGTGGERIGKVTAVYEATGDGHGTFATVATGLFGTSASFIPLDTAELQDDEVRIPYSKDVVRSAPRVEHDEDLTAQEEDRLFAYYAHPGGTQAQPPVQPAAPSDGTMVRSEERLHVGTERVETGRARLRKYVVTETMTQTVAVSHEELRIVREPIGPGELVDAVTELSEEEHEIVLSAERPVVQREVVPVERIRLDTEVVSGEQTVTEQVQKEQVEVLSEAPVTERAGFRPPAQEVETTTTTELVLEPRHDGPDDVASAGDTEIVIEPRH